MKIRRDRELAVDGRFEFDRALRSLLKESWSATLSYLKFNQLRRVENVLQVIQQGVRGLRSLLLSNRSAKLAEPLRPLAEISIQGLSVTRIFLTLSMVGTLFGVVVFMLGLNIGDAQARDPVIQNAIGRHMLAGVLALCFASLVHAIVFTYFMGTGRWIEETSRVYQLSADFHDENRRIKYRLLLLITGSFFLLLTTGALGTASDPASVVGFKGFWGLTAGQVHLAIAISALVLNLVTNWQEFRSIERNGEIIELVLGEVRRIRAEHGLAET